ncbi:hypothetical protein ACQY0O_007280 [Thecaphora frezii]
MEDDSHASVPSGFQPDAQNLSFDDHGVAEPVDLPHQQPNPVEDDVTAAAAPPAQDDAVPAAPVSAAPVQDDVDVVQHAPVAAVAVPYKPVEEAAPVAALAAAAPKAAANGEAKLAPGGQVKLTNYPTIANAPLPAEGNGYFNNLHLAMLIFIAPAVIFRIIPFVNPKWFNWTFYFIFAAIFSVPVTMAYWVAAAKFGPRINEKVALPGRPIEHYLDIKDPELRRKYNGHTKIPYQTFHDAYFAGKIEPKMHYLELLEYRHDWCSFVLTWEQFKFVLFQMIPEVIMHTAKQDETQIQDNYDRGDDFYAWFLGPQMIYTSGIISDPHREETLEELQDNKLNLVCSKLALKPSDRVLDIGCGWGTFATFAAKNYGCDVTGVTLAKTQTRFGNDRLRKNGIDPSQARILNLDYRDIPVQPGHYNKIISLEMAEHVGIRHYGKFLRDVYTLLDDDGVFVFQVAGLRPAWQHQGLHWGIFMNRDVFPGADASLSLGWVVTQLEKAGFEIRSVDVAGVHYSATILRWARNWESNRDKVIAKYGEEMYRRWSHFLWSSVIVAREGDSSVFQFVLHKNLNAYHRIEGVESHGGLLPRPPISQFTSVYK